MKKTSLWMVILTLGMLLSTGCKKKNRYATLRVQIDGLQNLGENFAYEGWLIVDGSPVNAGIFKVDDSGNMSQTEFEIRKKDLEKATAYVLTIEPYPDNDPAPSSVHILGGDFSGNTAMLSIAHHSALGDDFTTAAGKYILATPTDGANNNEKSGVWWLDPAGGSPSPGLALPALPGGWKYEGWAVINGVPVSTGKFTSVSGADESAPHSGTMQAPAFPGEDFLTNAPAGLSFPADLSGATVVISIEPDPDNSNTPFLLKPLVGNVPSSATEHTLYQMQNNALTTNPTGTATK
jgi:hypothetical protein